MPFFFGALKYSVWKARFTSIWFDSLAAFFEGVVTLGLPVSKPPKTASRTPSMKLQYEIDPSH